MAGEVRARHHRDDLRPVRPLDSPTARHRRPVGRHRPVGAHRAPAPNRQHLRLRLPRRPRRDGDHLLRGGEMNSKKSSKDRKPFRSIGTLLLIILLLPLILVAIITYGVYRVLILVTVWALWCTRGKFVLFVYSDSPIWQEYVTDHFLLKIRDRAIVLNWSERRKWTKWFSLSVMAFRTIGGIREFNPMAIV